ncbi:uncharacterized protein LOC131332800 [Rhododendron vialii]|uniref:uncharacterized protein LOC131332800 n=1 Tax=Rhododendron vialii TaxID=182163 RepID=UPI00265EA313|nr:uncharacterized protein LOC131332800 [Rhododendron vialii]
MVEPPNVTEFITKRPIPSHRAKIFTGHAWCLHVDGAFNNRGADAGIVLVSSSRTMHEQALGIGCPTTNNEAEYEALIAGLRLAWHMGAEEVQVYSDSLLIVKQLNNDYEAKDACMNKYMSQVITLTSSFQNVCFDHVGRDLNLHVDSLAGLGAICTEHDGYRTIILSKVTSPSFEPELREVMEIHLAPSWMDLLISSLKHATLPTDRKEEIPGIFNELHDGSASCHIGSRSLADHALSQGYWWKKMVHSTIEFAKQYYYTKWVEAKALITIMAADVENFFWKQIFTRFDVPYAIVSDNGTQIVADAIKALYKRRGIQMKTVFVSYPQGNGQAEAANKAISAGLKRRLTNKLANGWLSCPMCCGAIAPLHGVAPAGPLTLWRSALRLAAEADRVDKLRDDAHVKYAAYQQQLKKELKKFMPKWEGSFRVIKKVGYGSYELSEMDGTTVPNHWNAQLLRKFYA